MSIKNNHNQPTNRRRSLRIYEDVDLFYQKLDPESPLASIYSDHAPTSFVPPESEGAENNTLNVNISASGLSFTCKEPLKPGDYLMVRVLLLSSMTMVMSCCKVIYCKPSNPYEDNRYPYTIGAKFVNLRPSDKALLDKHIAKKRKWQWFIYTLVFIAILTAIYIPDVLAQLCLTQLEIFYEWIIEILYLLDELINYWISFGLSFIFPRAPQTVQIIGFYLQSALYAVLAGFLLFKWLPKAAKNSLFRLRRFYQRKKNSLRYQWQQLPWWKKIIWACALLAVVSLLILGML